MTDYDAMLEGMARTLWVMAYMVFAREADMQFPSDADWESVTPPTPVPAQHAAADLELLMAKAKGAPRSTLLVGLFEQAMAAERYRPPRDPNAATQADLAMEFGGCLALMAIGAGSWFNHHRGAPAFRANLKALIPGFRIEYDGDFLIWEGENASGKASGHELVDGGP